MDNNYAERQARNPVVGRKSYYGSGALWSATLTAMLFSLFQTLKLWDITQQLWLSQYLLACAQNAGKAPLNAKNFLPWNQTPDQFEQLRISVANKNQSYLWNEFIDRYHYLCYTPLPGAQLRYFVKSQKTVLALFGFGASAWMTAPRDRFIGWNPKQRQRNLHLVVNNARFLILPWVQSVHLASCLLGRISRQIAEDWQNRYTYRPVLLETFIETPRFKGSAYKATNWILVGQTQGRGKLSKPGQGNLTRKDIWLYPLNKQFRHILCK